MEPHQIMGLNVREIDSLNFFMTEANQWSGFFMIGTSVMKELMLYKSYNTKRLQIEITGGLQKVLP